MGLLLETGRMKLTMRMMRLLMMVIMRLLMMVMVRVMMMVRLMMMVMMMMTMTRHELFDAEERAGNIDGLVFVCFLLLLLVTSDFVTFVIYSGDLFGFHSLNNPYNLEGLSGITIDSINHSLWVHIFLVSICSNKVDIA